MASALVVVLLLLGLTTLAYGGSQTSPSMSPLDLHMYFTHAFLSFFLSFFSFVLFCFVLFPSSSSSSSSTDLAVNPTCSLPFSTGWSTGWNWGCNAGAFYPYNEASDSSAWQYVDIGMYRNFICMFLFSSHFIFFLSFFFIINLHFVASGTAQGIFSVNLQTGSGGDKGSTYLYFMDANKNVRTCFLSFSSCFTIIFCSFFLSPLSYNSMQTIMSYSKLNQVSVGSYAPQIIQAVIPSNARYAYIQMTCNKLSISSACVSYWTSASLTGM